MQRLRNVALKEEVSMNNADGVFTPTLLGFKNSLSRFVFLILVASIINILVVCMGHSVGR